MILSELILRLAGLLVREGDLPVKFWLDDDLVRIVGAQRGIAEDHDDDAIILTYDWSRP